MKNLFHELSFQFTKQDMMVILPIVSGLIGFIIFWFTQESKKIKNRFINKFGFDKGSAYFIIFTKVLGAITIGLIPFSLYHIICNPLNSGAVGLTFDESYLFEFFLWTIGLSLIIIPMVYKNARKPSSLLFYPQIRSKKWTLGMFIGNLAAWAIYLFGYELFFRGILLFPLVESIGIWPAIAVNIGLYSSTHIPKGMSEAIGAIPLAIVLCLLSIATSSIWIAFFVHLVMAWTNTLVAFRYNPGMHLIKTI